MIKVKIAPWKEVFGLKNTSTIWELALDREITNIVHTKEETIHLNYYSSDVDVPLGTVYYLRATRILNNGEQSVKSSVIEIQAGDTERSNVILEEDLKVDTPSVYLKANDIKTEDYIRVTTSEFRSNNDQHAYTHWFLEDTLNNVLWCSLYDNQNLTSINIPNINQPYASKSKLTFKAIHGTKLGVESKVGNISVFFKNVNFELINNLTNVKALQDLQLKFKRIDPNKGLGITRIEIFQEVSDTPPATYTDITENNTIINWWLLRFDLNVRMVIHAIDINGDKITIEKLIKVESYKNLTVPNPDLKYQKLLYNYYTTDEANDPAFYIPNNFISNYTHNGYIGIPKNGADKKLYAYELNDENKLKRVGEIPGITIENDLTKEGMFIKRINNDLLLISHTETVNRNKQHVMLWYTHMTNTGEYKELKRTVIENEEYGLGYTNALIQYDNKYIYYIPYQSDSLKQIDLEALSINTITENIPYVKNIKEQDINNLNAKKVTPIMLRLEDDRILIIGGYTPNGTIFDHKTQTFVESIFWENITYIGNELTAGNLINGDGIVVKKENVERDPNEDQDLIYNDSDFVLVESLEEVYNTVNEDTSIPETSFSTDLDEYEVLTGNDLNIILTHNFTSTDTRQYYVVYDKSVFRLDNKELNKITFHCLSNTIKGRKKVRIVASKDQIFDQETFSHYNNFTHNVVIKDIWINVENKENIIIEEDNKIAYNDVDTPASEAEHIYILGKKYNYNSTQLDLQVYKDPIIRLPIESLNVGFDHIELVKENYIDGTMDIKLVSINDDLFEIQISNITNYYDLRLTLRNKLREAEFVTIKFIFIEDLINGIPDKPIINRDNLAFNNFSVLSFFDLTNYNFDVRTEYRDPRFIVNKSNYCSFINGNGINKYKISLKVKKIFPVYITNLPDGVYSNSFVYINSVSAVPELNIGNPINLIVNTDVTAEIMNDLTGYIFNTENKNDDILISTNIDAISATFIDLTVLDKKHIFIKVKDRLGTGTFSVTFKNKADGSIKRTTFNFTVYNQESHPSGYEWTFVDYKSNMNNENIYLLPNSTNTFEYVNKSVNVRLSFKDDTKLFDTIASSTNKNDSKLVVKPYNDIGKEDVSLVFYNRSDIEVTRLTKRVNIVPMMFYAKNNIVGDQPIDIYPFTIQHNIEKSFFIYPKIPNGYSLTSIRLEAIEEYNDIKYYINNIENNLYEITFTSILNTEENKEFKFFINYTYANSNGNIVHTITKDNSQVMTVTSKYYMEDVYINIPNNRITMYVGDVKEINIDTNSDAIKLTAGESSLLQVDNNNRTITALKESTASLIIESGRPDQVPKLEMMYIDILKAKDDSNFEQGYVYIVPDDIKVFPGTGQEININTNAANLNITVEDTRIATYDSIRKMVIGKTKGTTRLKVVFSGDGIKGGTKYFNIEVFGLPEGDPDILYYDSFNHELLPTKLKFTTGYPKSMLFDRSGRVVLSKYETINNSGVQNIRTHYTVFY